MDTTLSFVPSANILARPILLLIRLQLSGSRTAGMSVQPCGHARLGKASGVDFGQRLITSSRVAVLGQRPTLRSRVYVLGAKSVLDCSACCCRSQWRCSSQQAARKRSKQFTFKACTNIAMVLPVSINSDLVFV